jgi:cellulose synthase/poly-beta-1,6-N-acetylglucosamine synthase-like glycosyltransferase
MTVSLSIFLILLSAAFLFGFYLSFMQRFRRGLRSAFPTPAPGKPTVSVVIAARNEERTIGALLTGLINQSYPIDRFEVIIADDESTDRTAEIVRDFIARASNLRLIRVQGRSRARSPKKNALGQGIAAAKGDIILTTDADCLVAHYWVESMAAQFLPGIDFVAGFSRTWITDWKHASLAQKFEFVDFYAIFAAAGGAILDGHPFSCSGQNLAYRRTAFEQVGGFTRIAHYLSGDDVHMMHQFRKAGMGLDFARSRHTYVYTRPTTSWSALIIQRARWASNAKPMAITDPIFFFYLTIAFLLNIGWPVAIFFHAWLGIALAAIKALVDYRFLSEHLDLFQIESARMRFFPVWFLLQPFYILAVTVLGLAGAYRWRGRAPRGV